MKIAGLCSPIRYRRDKNTVNEYAPGVPFDIDDDEGRRLIAAGVAREVRIETREVVVPIDSAGSASAEAEKPKRAKKKTESTESESAHPSEG